jgi:hypothetical protein
MAGPTRRDVERAIRQYQERDRPGEAKRPEDIKFLVGVSLDAYDLPEAAREHVERAVCLDSPAPVVVADDESAEDVAHSLGLPDAGRESGFETEALLPDAQDSDDDQEEGD